MGPARPGRKVRVPDAIASAKPTSGLTNGHNRARWNIDDPQLCNVVIEHSPDSCDPLTVRLNVGKLVVGQRHAC